MIEDWINLKNHSFNMAVAMAISDSESGIQQLELVEFKINLSQVIIIDLSLMTFR